MSGFPCPLIYCGVFLLHVSLHIQNYFRVSERGKVGRAECGTVTYSSALFFRTGKRKRNHRNFCFWKVGGERKVAVVDSIDGILYTYLVDYGEIIQHLAQNLARMEKIGESCSAPTEYRIEGSSFEKRV
jgi:hypothetical protein